MSKKDSDITAIGSCNAIIKSIKTTVDGSYSITFEINPDDTELISKLMRMFGENKKLITLGMAYKEY